MILVTDVGRGAIKKRGSLRASGDRRSKAANLRLFPGLGEQDVRLENTPKGETDTYPTAPERLQRRENGNVAHQH